MIDRPGVAFGSYLVTPDDDNKLDPPARGGIWVGVAGDVHFQGLDGREDTITIANNNTFVPIGMSKIFDTDTDADEIHALT